MLIMFSSWSQGDTSPKMIYRTKPTYRRFTGLTTVFIDQRPTITGSRPAAYFSIRPWRAIKTLALLLHSSRASAALDAPAKQDWYANLAGVWGIPGLLGKAGSTKGPAEGPGSRRAAQGPRAPSSTHVPQTADAASRQPLKSPIIFAPHKQSTFLISPPDCLKASLATTAYFKKKENLQTNRATGAGTNHTTFLCFLFCFVPQSKDPAERDFLPECMENGCVKLN